MKRKIAFISEHASPLATLGGVDAGGQNVYVDKLTKQLVRLGYEVDIYTRWDNPRLPEIVDCQNGVRVIHVKAGPVTTVRKEEIFDFMDEFAETMINFIQHEGTLPELIHANFWMSAYVAMKVKKALSIPFVITFHALGKVRRIHQGKADGFPDCRFDIEEKAIKAADHIVAECPQDREDLIVHYHAHQDNITIVPCGFDPNEFYPMDKRLARMTLGLNPDEKIILQLGRMVPRKGVDTVIEGLAVMREQSTIKPRLLIVGGESDTPDPALTPEIGRLQKLAKEKGVSDLVTFTGRKNRDQLKYYYNAADIFVSVPWYEPFGITPLESMACGTPVIGSRVGGIKFSVVDGKTGYLVPPSDAQALGDAFVRFFEQEENHERLKENAIKRVNTFFTWGTVAQNMATLYERVLSGKQSESYQDQAELVDANFKSFIDAVTASRRELQMLLIDAATIMSDSLSHNGKILICGNGGSATDAQHFTEELVGRFLLPNRPALPVISLTSDSSILTAVGNDFSFETIFSRQVEAYGQPGDVLIDISTSGNSQNIIEAFNEAHEKGMVTIGILGKDGGKMKDLCDIALVVPSHETARIQEVHTHLVHTLCQLIERQVFPSLIKPEAQERVVGIKFGKSALSSSDFINTKEKGGQE